MVVVVVVGWGTSMALARIKLSFAYFIYTTHEIRNHTALHLTYLAGQRSCEEAIAFPLRTSLSCAHSARRDSE